ncbi:DUF3592 domain-containing protein [Lysobacter sp. cf310]|uniref:DUF3592 domain-containing protein n=1 Tax=Lysobacter sp. cf310 TaxID=1761790 RepID=UPI0008E270F1|nr:DUF3592 domain-containing protein [Lysobacter sp. cf310]SFK35146.1 hypothetical protein SAMN04487938_0423 [Lysobacter sp. cf310]
MNNRSTWLSRNRRVVGLLAISVALAAAAWLVRTDRVSTEARMSRAEGTVLALRSECRARSRFLNRAVCAQFPLIGFYDPSGGEHRFQSTTGRGFRRLAEGQSVVVLYLRAAPARTAKIDGYGLTLDAILILLAAAALALTVVAAALKKR